MYALEPIERLTKDLKTASFTLTKQEARYLVDSYYQIQEIRIATANQCRIMSESEEPHDVLDWFLNNAEKLEAQIKRALDAYTDGDVVGRWAKSVCGIGPVIAAGLLAHIDIEKCPTAGHIWSFAGIYPGTEWKKGEKRPWNADLKTLCWKIGQSFVKVSNNPKDVYGQIYKKRKRYEMWNNENGEYADQAAEKLEKYKIGKTTEAYKYYSDGKLPPGHIDARARRYAVKMFLSHLHWVWYEEHYGKAIPNPYPIDHMENHIHILKPPNYEMLDRSGFTKGIVV